MSRSRVLLGLTLTVGLLIAVVASLQAQTPIVLRMQSTWPARDIYHETFEAWAKKVNEMAGGRLRVDVLPAGAVVPAFQLIDAVHSGILDGGHGVPSYWFGKHRAASLFGTGPSFGMDAEMLMAWMRYGGGQEFYNELLQEKLKLNVLSFPQLPVPTEPLGWFSKEIRSVADFKGLKFRTIGLAASLYQELGMSVVILPGAEIQPALERRVLDAAEFANPSSDRLLGLHDVRKVYMLQSYHQPMQFYEILFNKPKYEALAKDLQAILRYSVMAESADFTWRMLDRNATDLIELESKHRVKVVVTPKAVLRAQLEAWDRVIAKEVNDPFFAKTLQSQREWAARVVPLRARMTVDTQTAYEHYFKGK